MQSKQFRFEIQTFQKVETDGLIGKCFVFLIQIILE
jgi:hypothetical protein